MFLRRCERGKNGKRHTYWALVESVRTPKGSRQRIVAYLGDLKASEQSGWAQLGRQLDGKKRQTPQRSLFDPPHVDEPDDDEPVLVRLSGVRFERLRDFGDVWLALGLWRLLKLDEHLQQLMPCGREDVPWASVAAILTIARFCEPASEFHIEHTWYRRTALDDLLGVPIEKVHSDRLYAALDRVLHHKDSLEKHLRDRLGELFELEYDLLLYDVTSTYFEGQCQANELAKRGYSRDNRPDCLQVCIGLVVTPDGIPLGHEVFAGNRHDSTTVQEMIQSLEKKYGRARRVWVMDRGMVSEANLQYLRAQDASYIVGTPKAQLRKFEQHLIEQGWQQVQAGVEVKLVPGPNGSETFILARSADRRLKDDAIQQRFRTRLEAALTKLQAAAQSGRLRDLALANQRWGRLQQQYWRVARAYEVTIEPLPQPAGKACLQITWQRHDDWSDWFTHSAGCYLLRSNLTDVDAGTLWKRYIQLTEAEWAFRITKDELGIRPIWHQKADRVRAHILICFLAYVLWKTLAHWMQRSGLGDAPRTLIDELAKIKSGDVVLPARDQTNHAERTVRLRCVTSPDAAQKVLLNRLGVTLPNRLRRLDDTQELPM
jgi:hypothetical protein